MSDRTYEFKCPVCGRKFSRRRRRNAKYPPTCSLRCQSKLKRATALRNDFAAVNGRRFGRLVVVGCAGYANGHFLWRCKCDCGGETVASRSDLERGSVKGCGCMQSQVGSVNPRWRGGVRKSRDGYRMVYAGTCSGRPVYRKEARVIAERALGRPLEKGEVVHHINNMRTDNVLWNLAVMTGSEHSRLHWALRKGVKIDVRVAPLSARRGQRRVRTPQEQG
ncbi:MAG: HNH endonuclease [Kiritimatiellae bacterium]|nr:HNH endonuclease [Kiritimatiellia bacterium]